MFVQKHFKLIEIFAEIQVDFYINNNTSLTGRHSDDQAQA
jgi:hypothetical protein